MRFLIQRVTNASVQIDGELTGEIQNGFLVLIGISNEDTIEIAKRMVKKMLGLRIFEDANKKTNLSLQDVDGDVLLVSQFTLYADCKKGNRPSFIRAGAPDMSEQLYKDIIQLCEDALPHRVQTGQFGADMKVSLLNDGPFTIWLDSDTL